MPSAANSPGIGLEKLGLLDRQLHLDREQQRLARHLARVILAADAIERHPLGSGVLVDDVQPVGALADQEHLAYLSHELERGPLHMLSRGAAWAFVRALPRRVRLSPCGLVRERHRLGSGSLGSGGLGRKRLVRRGPRAEARRIGQSCGCAGIDLPMPIHERGDAISDRRARPRTGRLHARPRGARRFDAQGQGALHSVRLALDG
jgi:hypothetical protein